MLRILRWLLYAATMWVVAVYLLSNPRFWATLALVSERISYGAREAYNATKLREQERAGVTRTVIPIRGSEEPLPHHDDVIDAVSRFLARQRKDDA